MKQGYYIQINKKAGWYTQISKEAGLLYTAERRRLAQIILEGAVSIMLQSPDNKNIWEKAMEDIPCTHYQPLHMDKMGAASPSELCLPTYLGLRH